MENKVFTAESIAKMSDEEKEFCKKFLGKLLNKRAASIGQEAQNYREIFCMIIGKQLIEQDRYKVIRKHLQLLCAHSIRLWELIREIDKDFYDYKKALEEKSNV